MKHAWTLLLFLAITLMSCSDDTSTGPTDPITSTTVSGIVELPIAGGYNASAISVTSNAGEVACNSDFSFKVGTTNQHNRPSILIASNEMGEPVALGYAFNESTVNLNATSTAKALSLLFINALPLTQQQRADATATLNSHKDLPNLIQTISTAMEQEPASPLTGSHLDGIMQLAASISAEVYASMKIPDTVLSSLVKGRKGTGGSEVQGSTDWRSYVTVVDDDKHNQPDVFISNHSMAWYNATVTKDGTPLEGSPFQVERNKVYTYHFNNFVSGGSNKLLRPGDGMLEFTLKPNVELTLLDPFMGATIGMIGLTGNFDVVQLKGCMEAVGSTFSLIYELEKVGEKWRYSNYNTAEYVADLTTAVGLESSQLVLGVAECLSKQVKEQATKSVIQKLVKFAGSKAFGVMLMTVYGADISASVWSAANALEGKERGRQKDGRYPAIPVSVTPASLNATECVPISYTATFDKEVITGYPSFEWVVTGPKSHWIIPTSNTPSVEIKAFPEPGLYTIECHVTGYDDDYKLEVKGTGRAVANISPCEIPNLLVITPAVTDGRPNKQYTFTVSGGDGFITPPRYRWTFGDNTPPFESDGLTAAHTYTTEGSYQVRVEALDMTDRNAYKGRVRGWGKATVNITRPDCSTNNGSVSGNWPPTGEFNGLSIAYSFTGAKLDSVQDLYDFHTRRNYVGFMGSGTMTLSGTFKSEWSPRVSLTVSITAGNSVRDTVIVHNEYSPWSTPFSVTMQIPPGATTGSFRVSAGASYGNGEGRGLSVNGTMKCD